MRPPEAPPLAKFKKVNVELPRLEDYRGEFPPSFWELFSSYELPDSHENWIDATKLKEEADKANFKSVKLDITLDNLTKGVDIGVEVDEAKLETDKGENYESVYTFGEEFTDTLQSWVKDKIVAGPFTRKQLKERGFDQIKVIPVQVRPKPNGKLRIILDLSWPHLKKEEMKKGVPISVNAGIRKEKFPARMAGTKDILRRLAQCGREVEFCKLDWKSAYKHYGIRREDWRMQIICWGGRYFIELRMAFGTVSSPYYFDVGSDVIKFLAAKNVKVRGSFAPKCLDDIIPIGRIAGGKVRAYAEEYVRICLACGIKLAEESDGPGKVFGIGREGEVLGVWYDLKHWTWNIPEAKDLRLRNEIWSAVNEGKVAKGMLETIIGKITHYGPLVPGGKFNRTWLLKLDRKPAAKDKLLELSPGCKNQLRWWLAALTTCSRGAPIPEFRECALVEGVHLHTDAAGGAPGHGYGGVAVNTPAEGKSAWCQELWPEWINNGEESTYGVDFSQKLTFLEGFASLSLLTIMSREVWGKTVYLHVDNSGFCFGFINGSSRCLYAGRHLIERGLKELIIVLIPATICKAVWDLGQALGAKIIIVKQTRCSDRWSETADALSKVDMKRVKAEMGNGLESRKRMLPRELGRYIQSPLPDMELGIRLAESLVQKQVGILIWSRPKMKLADRIKCQEMWMTENRTAARKRSFSKGAGARRNRRRGKRQKTE